MRYFIAFAFILVALSTGSLAQDETKVCRAAESLLTEGMVSGADEEELAFYREVLAKPGCADLALNENETTTVKPYYQPVPISAGPFTNAQCAAATQTLALTDGKDQDAAAISLSDSCEEGRRSKAFDVRNDLSQTMALLKKEGVIFDRKLSEKLAACKSTVDAKMMLPTKSGDSPPLRSELMSTCTMNAQMALYAEGIMELNSAREADYAAKKNAHEAELAQLAAREKARQEKISADKAAYDASMAEWRRRVDLCQSGKREYCLKTD